ncbi:MAG TPA: mannonate dehydratase [Bryobacteraceae bacterium]|nr:mannonate dehydratase [Bryobacteraceae bacterium]
MNRRQFLASSSALAAATPMAATAPGISDPRTDYKPGKAVMVVGCQRGPINETYLKLLARSGVKDVCGMVRVGAKGYMEVEDIEKQAELCSKYGVKLMMSEINGLASSYIGRAANPSIMMGKSPDRDRAIDNVCMSLRNCAKAGLPAVKYNMSILGVLTSGRVEGRGGVSAREWDLSKAKQEPPLTEAGPSPAPVMWERITYFLDRAIPVANEYKVRMACHPHDPGVPASGFRGVDRVLGTVEGLKKFISIKESPYHGLNFCQGTVSEMLQDPGKEIFDVIRFFGQKKKIFNVHFRNIRGKRDKFVETYPDEGDVNFYKAIKVYKEVGYPYMMMPDHMPGHPDDPGGNQAFSFAYGYIKALIQAMQNEG